MTGRGYAGDRAHGRRELWTSPRQVLDGLGVDTGRPGFYDDPRFLAAERANPMLLEAYAAFIRTQRFRSDYLDRAEQIIKHTLSFLHERLVQDDQRGKCIDGSMVLMRFLERQGIWAYAVSGALTLVFADETGIPTTYFAPIMLDGNPAKAGHVWLVAPPYAIVDLSVQLQPYRHGEAAHLPPYVLAKRMKPCAVEASDLMEPEARQQFAWLNGRVPSLGDIERIDPGLLEKVRTLGAGEVRQAGTRLKYVATAITAPQEPLEEWRNLQLQGKYPLDLYEEFAARTSEGAPHTSARAESTHPESDRQ